MDSTPYFVIDSIKKYWSPGKKILEIGCGPAFLRQHFLNDYIGTDITKEAYSEKLPRDVDIVCPAEKLLVDNNSIDIVVVKSAFFLFSNIEESLNEVYRVLKPGGRLLLFDYNKKTQKKLQKQEQHTNYPCWNQWQLKKLVKKHGFKETSLLLAEKYQPIGLKKLIHLIYQELFGTWAIVSGAKNEL